MAAPHQLADHQTTRFKAAVSREPEHVCNWGNDGTSFDDAYSLVARRGSRENYNDEAAIWQLGKVRTPTISWLARMTARSMWVKTISRTRSTRATSLPRSSCFQARAVNWIRIHGTAKSR